MTTPAIAAVVPGVEQAVEGLRRVHAHAKAGNIKAKRRTMLALIAICRSAALMSSAMGRALSEPDQHYGPEVWEPISLGGMYLSAAASAFAQSDDALRSLLGATLAETMASGRQVPHHEQLTDY